DILLATIAVDEPGADGIMRLFKLDGESGETIWSKDLGSTGDWGVTGIAVAPDDTVYLAGQYLEPGQASELFVAAIGADGEQLWREQFTKPGSGITASTELLFWDDSTLMVGGYAGPGDDIDESFVLKLNLD